MCDSAAPHAAKTAWSGTPATAGASILVERGMYGNAMPACLKTFFGHFLSFFWSILELFECLEVSHGSRQIFCPSTPSYSHQEGGEIWRQLAVIRLVACFHVAPVYVFVWFL